jgi:predicted transcriptional regulator
MENSRLELGQISSEVRELIAKIDRDIAARVKVRDALTEAIAILAGDTAEGVALTAPAAVAVKVAGSAPSAAPVRSRKGMKRGARESRLLEVLEKSGPLQLKDLAEQTGDKRSSVHSALTRALKRGLVEAVGNGVWRKAGDSRPLPAAVPRGPKLGSVREQIESLLKSGPKSLRELMDKSGATLSAVSGALNTMQDKRIVERMGGGIWRLKADKPADFASDAAKSNQSANLQPTAGSSFAPSKEGEKTEPADIHSELTPKSSRHAQHLIQRPASGGEKMVWSERLGKMVMLGADGVEIEPQATRKLPHFRPQTDGIG